MSILIESFYQLHDRLRLGKVAANPSPQPNPALAPGNCSELREVRNESSTASPPGGQARRAQYEYVSVSFISN